MFRFLRPKRPGVHVSGSHSFFIHTAHWWRSDEDRDRNHDALQNTELSKFKHSFGQFRPSISIYATDVLNTDTLEVWPYLLCWGF